MILPALTLLLLFATSARGEGLPRVASTSVCADQYLLRLGAPEQIAALSADARDPALSYYAARARAFPLTHSTAEELITLKPDIVLAEAYGLRDTARILTRQGIRVVTLPAPESIDGVAAALREIGTTIGRAEDGEDAAAEITARRALLRTGMNATRPEALYLLPTGSTAGGHTYMDDILRESGLRNYAAERGAEGWTRVNLETIVRDPPSLLILSFFDRSTRTAITGFAANPVFLRALAHTPRIDVPNAFWICAGPMILAASEFIAERLHEKPLP